jgi:hypothetical protein
MSRKRVVVYDLDKAIAQEKKEKAHTDLTDLDMVAASGKTMERVLRIISIVALVLLALVMLFLMLPDLRSQLLTFGTLAVVSIYAAWRMKSRQQ